MAGKELKKCQGAGIFRFVFGHHPIYSVGTYADSGSVYRIRQLAEPLVTKYKVHMYISGHEHQLQAFENLDCHFLISGAVAQVSDKKKFKSGKTESDLLKFEQANQVGFVLVEITKNIAKYSFICAISGAVLYSKQ